MVKLVGILSQLLPIRALVIGDLMLDTYTFGKVKRISPEAPVSILSVTKEESLPGGAGNVALNLMSLGAQVEIIGRVGKDPAGQMLSEVLGGAGIVTQSGYKTPIKNRLIADAQQVLRVDFETIAPLDSKLEEQVMAMVPNMLAGIDIIAISDYGKGFLSRSLLRYVIDQAALRGIPVVVDPKGEDFSRYRGATVIKPNLKEAYAAAQLSQEASLDLVASTLLTNTDSDLLLITRSEQGISLFDQSGERFDFPVRSKEVKDVTGAGDTALAMFCLALGSKLDVRFAAQLANIAAGMAIERLGCARIDLSEMAERLLEYDVENKVFDEQHLFALQQALKGKRYIVLGVESHQGMNSLIFRSIQKLSTPDEKLIVYVRETDPDAEFVSLLSSLAEVDFIVLKTESLRNLCEIIHPHQVYLIENGSLLPLDHPTALLSRLK